MKRPITLAIAGSIGVLAVVVAAPGCEDTGLGSGVAGTCRGGSSGRVDLNGMTYNDYLVGLTPCVMRYTPTGCGFEVSTPDVLEAGGSENVFGAEPTPTNIHVSHAGPTSTSFAVNWKTDLETEASTLIYGTDANAVAAAEGASAGVTVVNGHHLVYTEGYTGTSATRVHEVHVCGLAADTAYHYKVGGAGHWSDVHTFTTAPAPGATSAWRFVVGGDARTPVENRWARFQKSLSEMAGPAVRLQVFSGDAVFLGSVQSEWDKFFGAVEGGFRTQDFLAEVPMMAANGNHDGLAVPYIAQFAFPQHASEGERGSGEEWYSFDYANAHFVVLNDTVDDEAVIGGDQAAWLEADLAAVNRSVTPWVFVVHHKPLYTCLSNHAAEVTNRAAWQPIFDRYDVDMVFAGHNHVYERSKPIRGLSDGQGIVAAQGNNGVPVVTSGVPSGTLYVVSAGAGADLYSVSNTCAFTQAAQSVSNYLVIDIQNRSISVDVIDYVTGSLVDSFAYTK